MAQRTAFLNSDAKGFNKDFHHTRIENYLIKQPGVMFSDYTNKPEFALGNGQIAGGKAIIRCARTTGTFAGEEILVSFESTATESISTSGNKKIFIEIPEVYVNDSTAITDALTQGVNLGVGRIVSDSNYPSHTNYIPLWEITGGDWENATDVRPEILMRGKPNTITYTGGNGEEKTIAIDNASLNKFLMSNGAGNAPSREEGGEGGGGENLRRAYTADTDLLAKSMFGVEVQAGVSDVDSTLDFGKTDATKIFFPVILNGEDFDELTLNLKAINSPADGLRIRIETLDSYGMPTGTLVTLGAFGTAIPSSTAANMTISMADTVTGVTAHTKAALVVERSGTASDSNYYQIGCLDAIKSISRIYINDGSVYAPDNYSGCVSCDGFATDAVVQATSLNGVEWIGYCDTGVSKGNDFIGIIQGTIEYSGATTGSDLYLSSTGTLTGGSAGDIKVAVAISTDVIQLLTPEGKINAATTTDYGTVTLSTNSDAASSTGTGVIQANQGPVIYSNMLFKTVTGNFTINGNELTYGITPTADFTVSAGNNLRPGAEYVLRVYTQATVRTMSLGTGISNPYGEQLLFRANKDTTIVFFATSASTLELWAIRTAL